MLAHCQAEPSANFSGKSWWVTKSPVMKTASGRQAVDVVHRFADEVRLRELVDVNVAELQNAKAIELGGKAGQMDLVRRCFQPMPVNLGAVDSQRRNTADGRLEKRAPRKDLLLGRRGSDH